MRKRIGRLLVVAGVLGVAGVAARRSGVLGAGGAGGGQAGVLPLTCRLQRHGWRVPRSAANTPIRVTCSRCQQIDVPLP